MARNIIFRNCCFEIVVVLMTVISCLTSGEWIEPRRSCREHYLNGVSKTAVLPMLGGQMTEIVWLECQTPVSFVFLI